MQVIVRLARQCGLPEPDGCVTMLALTTTSHIVRARLDAIFKALGTSEAKVSILVMLLALDPAPVSADELSGHATISPAAMTAAIDALAADELLTRHPGPGNRVSLTPDGRIFARHIVLPVLMALNDCAATLTAKERHQLAQACTQVCACFSASF
jgi:DNA-binding MarR family transcriptional regulator